MEKVCPGLIWTSAATVPVVPPVMAEAAVTVAVPPAAVTASVYVTEMVCPDWALNEPSLFAPAAAPNAVFTVAVKMPVFAPVSVKVRTSDSPVTVFTAVRDKVCAVAAEVFRSVSARVKVMGCPGMMVAGEADSVPVPPPVTVVAAVSVAEPPAPVSASK